MWPPAVNVWDPHPWSSVPQQAYRSRGTSCGSCLSFLQKPSSVASPLASSRLFAFLGSSLLKATVHVSGALGTKAPARLRVARTLALCPDVGGRVVASCSRLQRARYSFLFWHSVSWPVPISFCIKVSLLRTPVLWTHCCSLSQMSSSGKYVSTTFPLSAL